jgi:peroxiredoxin
MTLIEVGSEAPDFTLKTGSGEDFRLSDLRGQMRVMLVFYPKDFTPGCTSQLTHIQRHIDQFRKVGIEPFGVSADDAESHQQFCAAHGFDFELLVDEDLSVAASYGAVKAEGPGIERSVVIVGRDGNVIFAEHGAPPWTHIWNTLRDIGQDVDEPVNA